MTMPCLVAAFDGQVRVFWVVEESIVTLVIILQPS